MHKSGLNFYCSITLFVFITLSGTLFAQTGQLRVGLGNYPVNDSTSYEFRLYTSQEKLVYKKTLYDYDAILVIDSLLPGKYDGKILIDGKTAAVYPGIRVVTDSSSFIDFKDLHSYISSIRDAEKRIRVQGSSSGNPAFFGQTYQPGFTSSKETVNSLYAFGIRFTPLYYPSRHYGIGAHIGSSMGFYKLKKDKVGFFPDTFLIERYYYWKLSAAFNQRFVFIRPEGQNNLMPCFLDLSIGYNLPLTYRYTGVKRESKTVARYITNFNDFSAMARLGFGFLSFTAEYKLTDDIRPGFKDVPNLMFGIEFIFPQE